MVIHYAKIKHPKRKVNIMDIPWGAWVKELKYNEQTDEYDVIGIYDTITKEHKFVYF